MSFARKATSAIAKSILRTCLVCCVSSEVVAQNSPEALDRRVQQLIEQLDADRFSRRQRAQRELIEIGFSAVPALRNAANDKSNEVRYRARWLVEEIQYGDLDRTFAKFARLPSERIDVERGMWLIARLFEPRLKRASVTRQLNDLAHQVKKRLAAPAATADPRKVVAAMHHVLFVEYGFRGNTEDYNEPKNSSISYVLREKKGLPILLSHVMVSVADRIDVPIVGVPVPGRYMVKYDGQLAPDGFPKDDIVVNPFEKGRVMTEADLRREWPGFPAVTRSTSTGNREVMSRMLRNLLADCQQASNTSRTDRVAKYLRWMQNDGQ